MKKVIVFFLVFLTLNCSAFAKEQSVSQERVKEIQEITRVLLDAKHTGNYEKLTKNMSDELKRTFPECNVINLYAPIRAEVGEIKNFKTIEAEKTQYGDMLTLEVFYEKLTDPVKVKITVDKDGVIQDFYEYFVSQSEKMQVNQLMQKGFDAIYKDNDYNSFLQCFLEKERGKVTTEKFQRLQKNTVEAFGNFKGFSLENYSIGDIDFGQKVPARPVYFTYIVKYENKEIPFFVVPIDDGKFNIYFGHLILNGYYYFRALDQEAKSKLDESLVSEKLEDKEILELTIENKKKVNDLIKRAFEAVSANDYDTFESLFNTQNYKCEISDGEKSIPLTQSNFERLYRIVQENGGIKFEYSDDAVPFRGIMKTEKKALDYYGATGNEKYDVRMYSLFALRNGEIKIIDIHPQFVEKNILQKIEGMTKSKLSALERMDYETFISGMDEKEYSKANFNSLGQAIKNNCGQNPLIKRKMFGIKNNNENFVDFTLEYDNGESFDLTTFSKVGAENQVGINKINIDYTPASYMRKINEIAEVNLENFFNQNDFEEMESTFAPELLKIFTIQKIKELKENKAYSLGDKHYLKKMLTAKEQGECLIQDSNIKLGKKIKFRSFIYSILTDKGQLIFRLMVNDDYDDPKVIGLNFSYPMKYIGNLNELE